MGRAHGDTVKDASLVQVARWCELVQEFKGSSTCSASWFKRAKALVQKVQEFKEFKS